MDKYTVLAPTLARYALLVIGTKLTEGGWLPEPLARAMATDPALIEVATGVAVAAGALAWFAVSKAKSAIQLLKNF
ncbi:hypothetical protein ACM25O_13175 [Sulfitobacter pontiacus]